jgi:hypothetical protein
MVYWLSKVFINNKLPCPWKQIRMDYLETKGRKKIRLKIFKRIHFAKLDVLSNIDFKRHYGLDAFMGLHSFYSLQHFVIFLSQFRFYE